MRRALFEPVEILRYSIDVFDERDRSHYLGRLVAPTFRIEPARRFRLIAEPGRVIGGPLTMATGKKLPTWRITLKRNRSGVRIGTVEAVTAEDAIKIAIRNYGITDPEQQRRLVAQRIERG